MRPGTPAGFCGKVKVGNEAASLPDKLWAEMQRLLPHRYHLTSRTPSCLTSATLAPALTIPSQSVLPGSYPHFRYILLLLRSLHWLIIALRLKIKLLLLTSKTL